MTISCALCYGGLRSDWFPIVSEYFLYAQNRCARGDIAPLRFPPGVSIADVLTGVNVSNSDSFPGIIIFEIMISESLYMSCVVGVKSCVVSKVVRGFLNVLNRLYFQ